MKPKIIAFGSSSSSKQHPKTQHTVIKRNIIILTFIIEELLSEFNR